MDTPIAAMLTSLEILKGQMAEVEESMMAFVRSKDENRKNFSMGERRYVSVPLTLVCLDKETQLVVVEEFSRLKSLVAALDKSINNILSMSPNGAE